MTQPMKPRKPSALTIWRTRAPRDSRDDDVARISDVLLTMGKASEPGALLSRLLKLAEGGLADAWLSLADDLPGTIYGVRGLLLTDFRHDIEGSCVWLASALGSEWAEIPLAFLMTGTDCTKDHLAKYVSQPRWPSYRPLQSLRDWGLGSQLERFKRQGYFLIEEFSDEVPKTAGESVEERPILASAPTLQVLAAAPAPASQSSDKALIDCYRLLGHPIPMAPAPDPTAFADSLVKRFPWFAVLFEGIRKELVLARSLGRRHFWLEPRLLVGPSGIGKSLVAEVIGTLANVARGRILAAGSSDNRSLAGTARGWNSTHPAFPIGIILQNLMANPIIVVDEIDKATGAGHNGRIQDTLLTMLDPSANRAWPDECLLVDANLSAVTWIFTANHLHLVPAALRARCVVVNLTGPGPEHFDALLRGVLERIAEEFGAQSDMLPSLPEEVVDALRQGFAKGRLQARQLAHLVRNTLAVSAEGERAMAH